MSDPKLPANLSPEQRKNALRIIQKVTLGWNKKRKKKPPTPIDTKRPEV